MKVEIDLYALVVKEPKHDERVMVWNERFREWQPQVFNKECDCWDSEDGDDYERDLEPTDKWFRLPGSPE